jgi:hypothetical protein
MSNGVTTGSIDFNFFGGGYSVLVGDVSGAFDVSIASDVFVPVYANANNTLDFFITAGIETPTIFGEASGTIDFSLNQSGRIEFGIQSYLYSGNNEITFVGSATAFNPIVGGFDNVFPITFSGTMAQFSLGQTTGAFSYALQSKVINYTLLNKSRPNLTNGIKLQDTQNNQVNIKQEPNGVKIRNSGETFVEIR